VDEEKKKKVVFWRCCYWRKRKKMDGRQAIDTLIMKTFLRDIDAERRENRRKRSGARRQVSSMDREP